MKRRSLLAGSAAAVLAAPVPLRAQSRRRIGVLSDTARGDPAVEAMFDRLAELGWAEARNLSVEYLMIEPDRSHTAEQVRSLVKFECDLILTRGTPAALAVKAGVPATPMVFIVSGDPVAFGLVASLARPGGNATGLTLYSYQTGIKQYSLLKELVPQARRVAVMYEAGNLGIKPGYEALRKHPAAAGIQWRAFALREWRDVDAANLALLSDPVDGLLVFLDSTSAANAWNIVGLANRHRLPAVYGSRTFIDAGGLLSYGIDYPKLFIRTADYAARILNGAKPAELPVEQPTQFELVINLHVARSQGIRVPQAVLVQATEVIQ